MIVLGGREDLDAHLGEELGVSAWHRVTQAEVDAFAEATGDHNWIHTDVARAVDSSFGGTIAHGYFTLALGPMLAKQVYAFEGFAATLNYGLDRVRFPAPLPVGGRTRLRPRLSGYDEKDGGIQVAVSYAFDGEGIAKPVCVAQTLAFLVPA